MPKPDFIGFWDIDANGGTVWRPIIDADLSGPSMCEGMDTWPDFAFEDYDPDLHLPQDWLYGSLSWI